MTEENNAGKPHYKKRLRKGRLFFCLVLILALFGSCFAAGMRIYNRFFRTDPVAVQTEKEDHLSEEAFSERINLLLWVRMMGTAKTLTRMPPSGRMPCCW